MFVAGHGNSYSFDMGSLSGEGGADYTHPGPSWKRMSATRTRWQTAVQDLTADIWSRDYSEARRRTDSNFHS
jgi:hypothetical protein